MSPFHLFTVAGTFRAVPFAQHLHARDMLHLPSFLSCSEPLRDTTTRATSASRAHTYRRAAEAAAARGTAYGRGTN